MDFLYSMQIDEAAPRPTPPPIFVRAEIERRLRELEAQLKSETRPVPPLGAEVDPHPQ